MDFMIPSTVLNLQNIRGALIRMEDTILFDLIERAQFQRSQNIYELDAFPKLGHEQTFLDWILHETEKTHSRLRRYEAADENPFFRNSMLPLLLPPMKYPRVLAPYDKEINVNDRIKKYYVEYAVPKLAAGPNEQPENYGSCALADVTALQALSRRIHFGKFVAEAKFRDEREKLTELIINRDTAGIEAVICKPAVEEQVLNRVREKADNYAIDPHTTLRWSQKGQGKINPETIVGIYRDCIIPLTKVVEVDYLLRRLESEPEA